MKIGNFGLSRERILRMWAYFRRGWGIYVSFPLSTLNFLVIQYRLLIEKVSFLKEIFSSFTLFAIVVIPIAFSVAVVLGWWDYKKGSWKEEAKAIALNNPEWIWLKEEIKKIQEKLDRIEKLK